MILEKETKPVFDAQHRESVIQMPSRYNPKMEACADENQDTSEEELEDMDDPMILKYLHKKFSTKKRDWTGFVKNWDSAELEDDPLEGTSRRINPLNR